MKGFNLKKSTMFGFRGSVFVLLQYDARSKLSTFHHVLLKNKTFDLVIRDLHEAR